MAERVEADRGAVEVAERRGSEGGRSGVGRGRGAWCRRDRFVGEPYRLGLAGGSRREEHRREIGRLGTARCGADVAIDDAPPSWSTTTEVRPPRGSRSSAVTAMLAPSRSALSWLLPRRATGPRTRPSPPRAPAGERGDNPSRIVPEVEQHRAPGYDTGFAEHAGETIHGGVGLGVGALAAVGRHHEDRLRVGRHPTVEHVEGGTGFGVGLDASGPSPNAGRLATALRRRRPDLSGNPSTFSAMMLRWISELPPEMVAERVRRNPIDGCRGPTVVGIGGDAVDAFQIERERWSACAVSVLKSLRMIEA